MNLLNGSINILKSSLLNHYSRTIVDLQEHWPWFTTAQYNFVCWFEFGFRIDYSYCSEAAYTKLYWLSTARPVSESVLLLLCCCCCVVDVAVDDDDVVVVVVVIWAKLCDDCKSRSQDFTRTLHFIVITWGCKMETKQKRNRKLIWPQRHNVHSLKSNANHKKKWLHSLKQINKNEKEKF